MGIEGLALSTTLVALFNVVILLVILRKKVGKSGGKKDLKLLLEDIAVCPYNERGHIYSMEVYLGLCI